MIQLSRGIDDQIEDAYPPALQDQPVAKSSPPQPPSAPQEDKSPQGNPHQSEFDGYQVALGGVLEKKGNAKKDDYDTNLQHKIAAGKKTGKY